MRSCLILGAGRSGTSMVAGSLARSGAFLGDDLYAARACNPKGFFEAPAINGLNEALLAPAVPAEPALGPGQLWLAQPRPGAPLQRSAELDRAVAELCARRPFAYKDPRFAWTLPAWRPHLRDAGLVAVFRHPALTVTSTLEEVATAEYLRGVRLGREQVVALWIALHRRLLEHRAAGGDWLFLHYDQVVAGDGLERLGRFLEAEVDRQFPERGLARGAEPASAELPAEALELYGELCALAEHGERARAPRPATVRVAGVAEIGDGELDAVPGLVAAARGQRGVDCTLHLIDRTRDGRLLRDPELARGATVLAAPRHSLARALASVAEHSGADLLAFFAPGTSALPQRLLRSAQVLAARPDWLAVVCDQQLTAPDGTFVATAAAGDDPRAPQPLWHAGLCLRAAALSHLDRRAFRPALLELLPTLHGSGQLGRLPEALALVPQTLLPAARPAISAELAQLELERLPAPPAPRVSVLLAHHRRPDAVFACLESFCRQTVGPQALELIVVDDNSPAEQVAALRELELPVALTVLSQAGGGAANARNLGLPQARGEYLLFVNDDTLADPDLVERHLAAHAEIGRPAVVLGHFRQPPEALDNNLLGLLERSTHLFGYSALQAGADYDGSLLYTCNASVPLSAVRQVGAFDAEFSHYGCEDTELGLRLEDAGLRVHYRPECRAVHRHPIDLRTITRRQPLVARAHARLFQRHPRAFAPFSTMDWHDEREPRSRLRRAAPVLDTVERAARSLGSLDLGALRRSGESGAALAPRLEAELDDALRRHSTPLWWRGFLSGFEQQGVHDFASLFARAPWVVAGAQGPFALLRARRSDGHWPAVAARFLAGAPPGRETLLVWSDGADGPPAEELTLLLSTLLRRATAAGVTRDVALLCTALDPRQQARTFACASSWLPTGGEEDAEDAALAACAGVREEDFADYTCPPPALGDLPFPWRLWASPDWRSTDDARALAERCGPLLGADDACLVLAAPRSGATAPFLAILEQTLAALHGPGRDLEVRLLEANVGGASLAPALDGFLPLPSGRAAPAAGLVALGDAQAVTARLTRLRRTPATPPARIELREPRTAAPWRPREQGVSLGA
jgi:GT2 family glycosyltransferase